MGRANSVRRGAAQGLSTPSPPKAAAMRFSRRRRRRAAGRVSAEARASEGAPPRPPWLPRRHLGTRWIRRAPRRRSRMPPPISRAGPPAERRRESPPGSGTSLPFRLGVKTGLDDFADLRSRHHPAPPPQQRRGSPCRSRRCAPRALAKADVRTAALAEAPFGRRDALTFSAPRRDDHGLPAGSGGKRRRRAALLVMNGWVALVR